MVSSWPSALAAQRVHIFVNMSSGDSARSRGSSRRNPYHLVRGLFTEIL